MVEAQLFALAAVLWVYYMVLRAIRHDRARRKLEWRLHRVAMEAEALGDLQGARLQGARAWSE